MDTNFINELYNEEIESKNDFNKCVLQEGLFTKIHRLYQEKIKKVLPIGTIHYSMNYNNKKVGNIIDSYCSLTYINKTKSSAIKNYIADVLKCGVNNKDINKFYIFNKIKSELNEKYYLYKLETVDNNKYSSSASDKSKVLEVEELTLQQFIDKYLNDYEYKDNNSIINKRKQIYKKVISIARNVLNEIGKDKLNKGFTIYNYKGNNEDELNSFYNGLINYFEIIWYDAWAFTNNKARDEEEYKKFNYTLVELMDKLKNELSNAGLDDIGYPDIFGDWDDGTIGFNIKE